MIQRTNCDICGSENPEWTEIFFKNGTTFCKCKRCGFVFTLEIPTTEELQKIYDKSYYQGKIYDDYSSKLFAHRKNSVNYLTYFQSISNIYVGKILEIGCATGDFLDGARFLGYETFGIEISDYSASIAQSKGHTIFIDDLKCLLDKKSIEENSFDAVFLWDVFEHLAYPSKVLRSINRVLKNKGYLIINTLNICSPTVKLIGKKWSHYMPPFHLSFFSIRTIKLILQKSNFHIISFRTNGSLFYDDYLNKYYFARFLFRKKIINRITNKLKLGYVQIVIAQKKTNIK